MLALAPQAGSVLPLLQAGEGGMDLMSVLRDVSGVLANEKTNVTTLNTRTDARDHSARIFFTMEVTNTGQLSRILSRINQLPNVLEARRRH